MEKFKWSDGVVIQLSFRGPQRFVSNTRKATEVLLFQWPVSGGQALFAAKEACRDVMLRKQPPDYARAAFIAAAHEAGLNIQVGS